MSKKKKLNSKNPKYMDNSEVNTPKVKEKTLISNKDGVKIYAVKYENIKIQTKYD
jgi:hypothetical protein|tara:strand:- start:35 stop:199 length:165 start_codon:yes stop_codon:yes gene_type:complete